MAEKQVIRQDIVQIKWEVIDGPLKKLQATMKKFKQTTQKSHENLQKGWDKAVKGANRVKSALTPLNNRINGLGRSVLNVGKRFASSIGKIARKAVIGLTATIAAAGVGLSKCIGLASDLQETTGKVEVSFGSDSGEVMKWSKTSIKSMGLAQQSALDAAALFGDMGTSMGLSTKDAAKMSTSLVQLGADLSSFKNIGTDQAMTALNGIFTGETESLKTLGVVMTQTNLEQFALSKGIKKNIQDMTEAEKVNLRYAYVMEKTKNAQGDFSRTGGNWANQVRMLGEQFKQLGASIGKLPIGKLTSGLRVVNDWMTRINDVLADGWQKGDATKLFDIFKEAGTTIKNKIVEMVPVVAKGISDLVFKAKEYLISKKDVIWEGFKEVMAQGINFISKLFTGEGVDIEGIKSKIEGIKDKAIELVNAFKDNWPAIKLAIIGVVTAVGLLKGAMFACNAVIAINNAVMTVKKALDIAAAAKTWLVTAAQWAFNTSLLGCPVVWIIAMIAALIAIIVVLAKNWDKVKEAGKNCWEAIKTAWSKATDWLDKKVIQPIKDAFQGAWDFVTDLWGGITDFFSGLWDGIKSIVSKITGKAKEAKGDADTVKNGGNPRKYASGGLITKPHLGLVGEAGPEMIIPLRDRNRGLALWAKAGQMLGSNISGVSSAPRNTYSPTGAKTTTAYSENNTYAPSFTLNFTGTTDRAAERIIKQWVQESLEEMFNSMSRTSPRLTEV